jgi:hypothetical protein
MPIVFGLGSGRCGTNSLQALLNAQPNSVCFHELNPSSMAWEGAELTVLSLLRDFSAAIAGHERYVTVDRKVNGPTLPIERYLNLDEITVVGDVASYYLPYVRKILETKKDVRFPCLKRERGATVESFRRKLARNRISKSTLGLWERTANHWVEKRSWFCGKDGLWDRLHPIMSHEGSLRGVIGQYWDYYYETATQLESEFPGHVKIFPMELLQTELGRKRILEFCGVNDCILNGNFHANSSR